MWHSMSKDTEKQLHAIHFLVATHNVCPLAIPEPWDVKSPHNEAFLETARLIWRRVNSTNVYALRINLKIECSESEKMLRDTNQSLQKYIGI